MAGEPSAHDRQYVNRALETSLYVGLALLLTIACLLVVLPFVPMLAWGTIIAIAV